MPITIGDKAVDRVVLDDARVRGFATVTGDFNPLHIDDEAAKASRFGKRIVHGMLGASLFSAMLAERLPGPGTIYLSQTLTFRQPIFVGDEVEVSVEVMSIVPEKRRVLLRTIVRAPSGETAIEGEATVLAPTESFA